MILYVFITLHRRLHRPSADVQVHSSVNDSVVLLVCAADLRHPGERPVGRHDGEGEAAAVVPAHVGGLPRHALRQLHHQLEGREALQRHHPQTQVSHHTQTQPTHTYHTQTQVRLA